MKRLFTLLFAIVAALSTFGTEVQVKVTGLESPDVATISIASYTYLETIEVSSNGDYTFTNVPDGTHYVKIESSGYNSNPSKEVIVKNGSVTPSEPLRLALTKQSENPDEWTFQWEEDGSPAGYTQTSNVNKPVEIEFLGKKIVPADVPSFSILETDYHIYLDNDDETWSQEYAYRLVETLKTLPLNYSDRPYAVFHLTSQFLPDDITVNDMGEGYDVTISKEVFYYANPFLVDLDGVRGRLFSKRLHHALTNFVTDFGNDVNAVNSILSKRFGCEILNINYEELTKNITDETETHFQQFIPSETVSIINMLEELPEGFHATPHLKYLIRRINGMPHPIYPDAAAVAWPVETGYIEFMESAFGGNNQEFETLRLILHEKSHFLWAFVFSDEIKNEWIKIGGWYEDPNAPQGWSTTKDVEFVSAYAHSKNPNEDMAESIAFYLKNPDMLRSRAPEKYDFICDRIMHGTRYISKIPDHLTFEVLNLFPDYDYPGKIKNLKVTCAGARDEDKTVTVEIELNNVEGYDDSASGAYVRITSPTFICADGTKGSQFVDLRMQPVDASGHILRGSVEISKFSKSGHWTAGDIVISDLQGYQRFEGQNDCVFDLFVNNPMEDIAPPKYEGGFTYEITDTVIEGHNAKNLQIRFKVSDNVGIQRVLCRLQFPGSTYCQDYDGEYLTDTGEAIVNIPVTEYFRSGDYYINNITLDDIAGNKKWFTFSKDVNDYPIEYIHIETADPDSSNPEIDLQRMTVYAEPTHPEAPDGETLVTISFYARDDKSGLGKCTYRLRDPQGTDHFEYYYHRNFYSLYFDGDPTVWEHYLIKVVLPQGSAPGIWGLAQMTVADKAFNEYTYNFVETLIFEPDNDISGYELFADIEDSSLIFHVNAQDDSPVSYKWRVIHEESGLEICGDSNSGAKSRAKNVSESESNNNEIRADISNLPKGDLILIVEVRGEDGNILSVKTKRVAYIETVIPVESITLSSNEWTGVVGSSFQLTATVLPENATDKTIVWSSSDETVATVDSEGKVMTLKVGEADIVAVCDTISSKCHVKVNPILAESIELDPSSWIGFVGESFSITATVSPENTTDKTIVWSSSDETAATVDSEGMVMTLKVGEADIVASCDTISSKCHVKVNPILAASIELDPSSWTGFVGESFSITATVSPENTTDKTIVWSSSDETVATVDSEGKVITLTVGEAFITAACGTSESSCHVIINPILVESIQLDPYTWSGNIGENFRITATVLPENASDKTLVWSTSDETIATVTSDGLVNITGSGLCTVRATSCDGSNIYAECSILTDQSGIDVIFNDQNDVDVYNMKGYLVKKQCGKSDFLLLEPGVYILRFGKVTKTILKK